MEYSEKEIEIIAKSMYKAVKKALSKDKKDVLNDLMDDNYVAEEKEKAPVARVSQMKKNIKKCGTSGLMKLKDFKNKIKNKHNDNL